MFCIMCLSFCLLIFEGEPGPPSAPEYAATTSTPGTMETQKLAQTHHCLPRTNADDTTLTRAAESTQGVSLDARPAQPQRIADDRHGTQAHGRAGDDGTEQRAEERIEHTRRDRDS